MVKFEKETRFVDNKKVYKVLDHTAGPTVLGKTTTVHHCVNILDDSDEVRVHGSDITDGVELYQRHVDNISSLANHPQIIHGYTIGEWIANKLLAKTTWITSGDGSNLNISDMDIALPTKLTVPIDDIIEQCKKRIILHTGQVNSKQKADMDKAVHILLRDFKEAYKDMPDNIVDILINELLDADGNYVLRKGSRFKCGDSGKLPRRINEQVDGVTVTNSNFSEYGFCLQPPSRYISSGMVNQGTIDDLLALCNLPMLGGLHPDCYPIWVKKILRQVVEFYSNGSYDFVPGPVLEWILRAPSEIERKVNDLDEINTAIQRQEHELQKIINMKLGMVNDKDTWTTIQSFLSLESSLEYFQDPNYYGLTPHLAKSNVDKEQYGEFTDLISEPPYYTKAMPMIDKLNNVLDRDDVSKEDTQPILDSMETNVYQEPGDEEHCQRGYAFITKLDEQHTEDITRMRSATIDTLRSGNHGVTKDEFKQLFGTTIEFTGLKFFENEDGSIRAEDGHTIMYIHQTKKNNNVIIERGSHYRALSPKTRTVNRLNALYNYNYESMLMNKIGKLSNEGLNNIQRSNLTRTMLIMGIDKQGSNEDNFWYALMYTLPDGVSDPGKKIGQKYLQDVIKISREERDINLTDRDTLPIDLIYLMIWKVPEINKLLELYGGKVRIDSTEEGKDYLRLPNESGDSYLTYYKHYDRIHQDESVTKAINYINGVRGKQTPLLLDVVATTLSNLYDSIDQKNFVQYEREMLFDHRAVQFLDKFKCEQDDLLSEAFDLFLPMAGYALLKTFLQHVKHMDEHSEDDKNKFVDANGKGWLVLLGQNGTPTGLIRKYLFELMEKVGREYELMRKHLVMKGYPHMANRDKYNQVMKMKDGTTASGERIATKDAIRQGVRGANSGYEIHNVTDELANTYLALDD